MKKLLFAGLGAACLCSLIFAFWVVLVLSDLPDVTVLKHYRPAAAAEVLDRGGRTLITCFDRKFRIWIPVSSLPDIVIHAVVTAEDDTFFGHRGVNYKAAWDALVHDVQKRRFARGGSTITQQMIKNVLLTREKTITRKFKEYVLARKAEELLSKRQILQIYLNEVEWGDNIFGIEAASRFYLDKHASELSAGEAALLAGMLPNPRYFNPYKRPDKAKDRQQRVLANMLQAKLITAEDYSSATRSGLNLRPETSGRFSNPTLKTAGNRPCNQDVLEKILFRFFGEQHLYRGGLTVHTSLDKSLQDEMNRFDEPFDQAAGSPGQVVVVKQGSRIRAIICSTGKESMIREALSSSLAPGGYELAIVSMESVEREQIVLEGENRKDSGTQVGL